MKKANVLFLSVIVFLFNSCNQHEKNKNTIGNDSKNQGESLYLVSGEWLTEENTPFLLESLKGDIVVVSMIFSHCEYACPRLVEDMKLIEKNIPKDKRDQVRFLLVSFDVKRDSPQRLKEFKEDEQLGANWTLLHGEESEVRTLSVLLDIKYEKQPNGNFAHSNNIIVLDQNGVIRSKVEGLGSDPELSLKEINGLLK